MVVVRRAGAVLRWVTVVLFVATVATRIVGVGGEYTHDGAQALHVALQDAGFPYPLLTLGEAVVAVGLVVPRTRLLATLLLAPIAISIAAFHVVLDPTVSGLVASAVLIATVVVELFVHRDRVRVLLGHEPVTAAAVTSP